MDFNCVLGGLSTVIKSEDSNVPTVPQYGCTHNKLIIMLHRNDIMFSLAIVSCRRLESHELTHAEGQPMLSSSV